MRVIVTLSMSVCLCALALRLRRRCAPIPAPPRADASNVIDSHLFTRPYRTDLCAKLYDKDKISSLKMANPLVLHKSSEDHDV